MRQAKRAASRRRAKAHSRSEAEASWQVRVVVSGAAGRLGRRVLAHVLRAPDLEVTAALVRPGSPSSGVPLEILTSEPNPRGLQTTEGEGAISAGTVLVETATREAALLHASRAAEVASPMLIATTGFDREERRRLESYADRSAVLIAANLSAGVAVLADLVLRASKALADYDLEVLELHHRRKRDAPSGTAWELGRCAARARGLDIESSAILARAGETGLRGETEIGMQAIRGGDIAGEHTVYLIGETERLELTHRAATRDVFAAGAVRAARFLGAEGRAPGLYTMRDVLGLG